MIIVSKINRLLSWRNNTKDKIGFVPTMGAIHEGHLSLISSSKKYCDITIVSIFLNPKQFSKGEDLEDYPVNLQSDIKKLNEVEVDILFNPNISEIYPENFSSEIIENKISKILEGKSRPEFFSGVLTVIAKLFNIIRPHYAFFGNKDAQQLRVIKKFVLDFNYPIKIISCSTIREKNGLAMSSRNKYFNDKEKAELGIIYNALFASRKLLKNGERNSKIIKKIINETLLTNSKITIDYISIADDLTLKEIKNYIDSNVLISVAVYYKNIRLIDNFNYEFKK